MSTVDTAKPVDQNLVAPAPKVPSAASARWRQLRIQWHVLNRNLLQKITVILLIAMFLLAVVAPYVVPYPDAITGRPHPNELLKAPSWSHPMGTDEFGRDILSRVMYGTRISLLSAFATMILAVGIGASLGVIAAGFGGIVDEVIMRITDVFMAFPTVVLAIVITAFWGGSLRNAIIALAISWWPFYARLVRGQAVSVRERPFVKAATSIGSGRIGILFNHILRNCTGPTMIAASLDMGAVILSLAALSFLGLGAQPPLAEWGLMINQSRQYFLEAWWYMAFPGLAIFIAVFCFCVLGEGLGEVLNPKIRGRG